MFNILSKKDVCLLSYKKEYLLGGLYYLYYYKKKMCIFLLFYTFVINASLTRS